MKVLRAHPSMGTLVFCRTKATVAEVCQLLKKEKVNCEALHGDLDQTERDRATALFRNCSVRILVATDVAARGLDIDSLELVINVDLPSSPEIYIHRIGRTGRAGRKGAAVSLATAYEIEKIQQIEQLTGVKMIRQDLVDRKYSGESLDLQKTLMKTLQICGGKIDKLRPGDILGALTSAPQAIEAKQIGKIEIHERHSHVAVASDVVNAALEKLRNSKIKGSKFKIYLV